MCEEGRGGKGEGERRREGLGIAQAFMPDVFTKVGFLSHISELCGTKSLMKSGFKVKEAKFIPHTHTHTCTHMHAHAHTHTHTSLMAARDILLNRLVQILSQLNRR